MWPKACATVVVALCGCQPLIVSKLEQTSMVKQLLFAILAATALAAAFIYVSHKDARSTASIQKMGSAEKTSQHEMNSRSPAAAKTPVAKGPIDRSYAYSASKDLSAYIDELQASGKDKGEIPLAKAKAIDECAAVRNPGNYVPNMVRQWQAAGQQPAHMENVRNYASETVQRCAAFPGGTKMSMAEVERLYAQAAADGNTTAIARKLKTDVLFTALSPAGDTLTSNDFLPTALNLIRSNDPSAILELSDLMGENSKLQGIAAGSARAEAAWRLVACDLGLDCSHGSSLLRQFCLNGGMYCGDGDLRTNMMNTQFSPDDFSRVQQLEGQIYQALQSGDVGVLFVPL